MPKLPARCLADFATVNARRDAAVLALEVRMRSLLASMPAVAASAFRAQANHPSAPNFRTAHRDVSTSKEKKWLTVEKLKVLTLHRDGFLLAKSDSQIKFFQNVESKPSIES